MAGPCYYVNINSIGNSALYCTEKSEGDLQLFCKRKKERWPFGQISSCSKFQYWFTCWNVMNTTLLVQPQPIYRFILKILYTAKLSRFFSQSRKFSPWIICCVQYIMAWAWCTAKVFQWMVCFVHNRESFPPWKFRRIRYILYPIMYILLLFLFCWFSDNYVDYSTQLVAEMLFSWKTYFYKLVSDRIFIREYSLIPLAMITSIW